MRKDTNPSIPLRLLALTLVMMLSAIQAISHAESFHLLNDKAATPAKYFLYVNDGALATITGYSGPKSLKKIVIPSKLGGYRVVGIGDGVFNRQRHIKSVKLPAGLDFIGDGHLRAASP